MENLATEDRPTGSSRMRLDEIHFIEEAKRARQTFVVPNEDGVPVRIKETLEAVFARNGVNVRDVAEDLQKKYKVGKYHPDNPELTSSELEEERDRLAQELMESQTETEVLRTKANSVISAKDVKIVALEEELANLRASSSDAPTD